MKYLAQPKLNVDGFSLGNHPSVQDAAFQEAREATYSKFEVGRNANNKLKRGIRWGIFLRGEFRWTDRDAYSLPAAFNPEEGGVVRRFTLVDRDFLTRPDVEAVLREVFENMDYPETSHDRAYEVQIGALRYMPTLAAPSLPAPIGPHQDMVDGTVIVVGLSGDLTGGQTRIYSLDNEPRFEFDLKLGEALNLRDAMVKHQVTPIQLTPGADWRPGDTAFRDVMIVRFQPVGR